MKPSMLKVHFFARGYNTAKPTDNITIYCQLEILGINRDTPFSTKIRIQKKFWEHNRIKDSYHNATFLNTHLHDIERCLLTIHQSLVYSNSDISYKSIRDKYCSKSNSIKSKPVKTFVQALKETIQHRTKTLATSTANTYRTRNKNIQLWIQQSNYSKLLITELKHRHFSELNNFLISLGNIGLDHRNKHLTLLKQVLDYALNSEYITTHPVSKLNLHYSQPKPPKYLTPNHRQSIEQYSGAVCGLAKDVAIFLLYTGLSYTDYLTLNQSHILKIEQGAYIKKKRNKTDIYQIIPILPQAKIILDKYGIDNMPRPDMSDLNKELKYLQELCNIPESIIGFSLSTSVFRETFASMMENEFMLPTRVIMTMMGHSTTKQLNTYSNIMPSRIHHDLSHSIPNWQDIIAA